ncbi:hypothetical protein [Sinomonas sp. P10A9]|uniref:Outer membrane channel protein CpnT-like N-terminal domain-containing protein n=1 Tax=Sinomonas puerhi TaxID=3238584 RepID=A0AB39L2V7_9MICC
MTAIVVDAHRLVECASHVAQVQGEVLSAAESIAGGLAQCGGMAGNDPAGADWSDAYDPAAAWFLGVSAALANRMGSHVRALNESGAAYEATEAWFGGGTPQALVPALAHSETAAQTLPEARGGTAFASPDPVTQAVVEAIGTVWPNGDADQLRTASSQWAAMATTLDSARRTSLACAAGCLEGMSSPAVSAARDRERELDAALSGLSGGATELSAACGDLASHIDAAHQDVRNEIRDLAIELGATVAISALTAVLTAGASAVAGSAASAGRVALAVARVTAMFERLASLARIIARNIGRLKEALTSLAARIVRWTAGRLPPPIRRLPLNRVPGALERLTDNWVVRLATEGPSAALAKVLEKPATALGKRLGESTARRALVLGWRRDLPGVREALARTAVHGEASGGAPPRAQSDTRMPGIASGQPADRTPLASMAGRGAQSTVGAGREAVARAVEEARTTGVAGRVGQALTKQHDAVVASVSNSVKDSIDNESLAPELGSEPNLDAASRQSHVDGAGSRSGFAAASSAAGPPREDSVAGERGSAELPARWALDLGLPSGEGVRVDVPKALHLVPGVDADIAGKKITGPFGTEFAVSLPGPGGKLVDSGLNILNAADLGENWWHQRAETAEAFRSAAHSLR